MARETRYFMWGFQSHFRIARAVRAKALFEELDSRLEPEVFLVGIRIDPGEGRYPACVEPEDDFWIHSEAFDHVLDRAHAIVPTFPDSRLLHSHALAQRYHNDALHKRAVRAALQEVIDSNPDKPEGMVYHPSWPVELEGFLVSLVLGLPQTVIDSYASLISNSIAIHEYSSFRVPRSLIEAVVDEYLRDSASELLMPEPGSVPLSGKSRDELLPAAGSRMIGGAAARSDTFENQEGSEWGLFDVLNRVSCLRYEGAEGAGRILLGCADHPCIRRSVTFEQAVSVDNTRLLRKLLELTRSDLAFHMNAKDGFGLAQVADYEGGEEDLYHIDILGHHQWELSHAGKPLMHVCNGLPSLPADIVDPEVIRIELRREFRQIAGIQLEALVTLICEAAREKRGTTLVITEKAASEAARLSCQATPINPCPVSAELLRQLTPIDGAVLLDPQGMCHSIGVILDGLATKEGNSARGSRYNSAVRYVSSQQCARLAVVVSEDGGVDLIPTRRPPIGIAEIESRLSQLRDLSSVGHVNRRRYRQLLDWFDKRRFYLSPEHCEALNRIVAGIEDRFTSQDPKAPHIVRGEFSPSPSFDPQVYYRENLP